MSFQSILYSNGKPALRTEAPRSFHDLHIDKIVDALLKGMEEYDLAAFYYTPLDNVTDIIYRQEILRDMEDPALASCLIIFTQTMHDMRVLAAEADKSNYTYQKKALFLELVNRYCTAVELLASDLSGIALKASGWRQLNVYLSAYIKSEAFVTLNAETSELLSDFSAIRYAVILKELRVQVRDYRNEADFSSEVSRIFNRFKREPVKSYLAKLESYPEMNHVEAGILEGVVTLYPDLFHALDSYCAKHAGYLDPVIAGFDREIHFYMSWQQYAEKLKHAGLSFCFPEILTDTKNVCNYNGFDVALAAVLVAEHLPVITNDFYLDPDERIIIVSGPNQGGKTTFARSFGQLHYLASIGLSVPGSSARLLLCDEIFTHFEKEEDLHTHRSKFEDDLFRIHEILMTATTRSIIIFNEILSSTTLQDALLLSRKVMDRIDALDCLCIWVTFMDELISFSPKTVSMVSTIEPEDPTVRTFKIIRKPADGLAYALSIAEKYGVTYSKLKERFSR